MLKLYTALHPVNPPDSAEMLVKKCPLFFQVLNLFLALLLSSFGGDALNSGGGEDPEKPKKSRLQRLIEWTKKKRKKKSANTVISHYMKSVQIRSFVWSEHRKIRTRKNSVFGHFSRIVKSGCSEKFL